MNTFFLLLTLSTVAMACTKKKLTPKTTSARDQGTQAPKVTPEEGPSMEPNSSGLSLAYEADCQSCHGKLEQSNILGSSIDKLKEAFKNVPEMGHLKPKISDKNLNALSSTLEYQSCEPNQNRVRRISRHEFFATIRELSPEIKKETIYQLLPEEQTLGKFTNNGGALNISPEWLRNLKTTVRKISPNIVASKALPRCGESNDRLNCIIDYIKQVTTTVTGQTPSKEDLNKYLAFTRKSWKDDLSISKQEAALALEEFTNMILLSPHTILTGFSINDELSQNELAMRLARFLWGSVPDETLRNLAQANLLREPKVIEEQVARMVEDPRFNYFIEEFTYRWLELNKIIKAEPDPKTFPGFSKDLLKDMRTAAEMYIKKIFAENLSPYEIVDSKFRYLNDPLAKHLGLPLPGSKDLVLTNMEPNTHFSGFMTHGAIMVSTSTPQDSSVVKRGQWVLDNILCEMPPPPTSPEQPASGEGVTKREIIELHSNSPDCKSCHKLMDPVGFSFEGFDATGKFDENRDQGATLANGVVLGNVRDLQNYIKSDNRFTKCFTEKMVSFAINRLVQPQDRCAIEDITKQIDHTTGIKSILSTIVKSNIFQKHGGKK